MKEKLKKCPKGQKVTPSDRKSRENTGCLILRKRLALAAAITVILCMTILLLSSCSEKDPVVLEYDGVNITEKMYNYWFITLKKYYVDQYSDITDSQESWNTELGDTGQTYAQFVDAKIKDQICYYLAGNVLFKEYGLKLEDSVKENIQLEIDDAINSFGSRSQYNSYLERNYGIDSNDMYSIKVFEQKFYRLYEYLYDEDTGTEMATDEEKDEYFLNNYARIKYLMVLKKYDYKYDEDGDRVTDSTGNYVLESISDEEAAARKDLATLYYNNIKDGSKTMDEYLEEKYSDIAKTFPNGYYVVQNIYYSTLFTTTIITAAFDIEPGEVTMTENEDAYFIIERLELEEKAYEGADKSQFSNLSEYAVGEKFTAKFGEIIDAAYENENITGKYSVLTVD